MIASPKRASGNGQAAPKKDTLVVNSKLPFEWTLAVVKVVP
jgi:hypothetical protein